MTTPDLATLRQTLHDKLAAQIEKAAADYDPRSVVQLILTDINKARREVTLKLLGLDNRWGRWEVDHCNGRASPITDFIGTEGQELISTFLRGLLHDEITRLSNDPPKAIVEAFRKEVRSLLARSTSRAAEALASEMTKNITADIRKEITGE